MVLIDKAEELISRGERMLLANVILQHPALSAEGVFEQGIMSLAEPEQCCWAEPGDFRPLTMCIKQQCVAGADYSSLTLSTVTKRFAVVRVEGHKDISNIIEKNFIYLIFYSDFTDVGQRSTSEMNRLPYWIISSCVCSTTYHRYLFKMSSRGLGIVVEDAKVNFHLVVRTLAFWFTPGVPLEWRPWLGFFFNIYFLPCSLLWSAVGGSFAHTGKGKLILFCFRMNKNDFAWEKMQAEGYEKGRLRKQLVIDVASVKTEKNWGCSEGKADE